MTPGLGQAVAFLGVVLGGGVLCLQVVRSLAHERAGNDGDDAGGSVVSLRTLALVSAAGLFVELLLIRWISAEIRVFAYFKNFILIAAFLGFGIGFQLSHRRIRPTSIAAPFIFLVTVVALQWQPLRALTDALPQMIGPYSSIHIWRADSDVTQVVALTGLFAALLISCVLFCLVALSFVPVGQLIGWQIEHASNGIHAYTVNLLGSLAGILLFVALASLRQSPSIWVAVGWLLLIASFWKYQHARPALLVAAVMCVALVASADTDEERTLWSPYQKLSISAVVENGETRSYLLTTNDTWYQQIVDLSDEFVEARPELLGDVPNTFNSYNLPYRFANPGASVLVLGSGMGNDVAGALRNDASRVVAVEIDPVIIDLGRELHFEQPYSDPRVDVVVDDARAFVERADERFDLIVFALLDSHTTVSSYSNVRIDNYVYTSEAISQVAELLTPDGVMVVKFQVDTPWIGGRLQALLTNVFGHPPLSVALDRSYSTSASFFIAGSQATVDAALDDPELASFFARSPRPPTEATTVTTDDWPFFYQQAPGVPFIVAVLSTLLVAIAAAALRRMEVTAGSVDMHFFFLGAGFLLVEVHIVSRMALLFGTTWLVNAVVISAVLLLAVAANLVVARFGPPPGVTGWAGLFVSIGVSYLIDIDTLLVENMILRILLSGIVLCAPAFFAGLIFISSFAHSGFRGSALGWNLVGALVGGLAESLSLWTGLRSMAVLAGVLYLGALVTGSRRAEPTRMSGRLSPT